MGVGGYMLRSMRDNWCKALRSGDYAQTTRYLHNDKGFCCLGVLCELNLDKVDKTEHKSHEFHYWQYDNCTGLLPSALSELFYDIEVRGQLMKMNDNGSSFSEIADWIEQNVRVEEDNLSPTATESGVLNHG
jgi:hypothetical protein